MMEEWEEGALDSKSWTKRGISEEDSNTPYIDLVLRQNHEEERERLWAIF